MANSKNPDRDFDLYQPWDPEEDTEEETPDSRTQDPGPVTSHPLVEYEGNDNEAPGSWRTPELEQTERYSQLLHQNLNRIPGTDAESLLPVQDSSKLPNLLTVEEDEVYHGPAHPTGFRRANDGDLSERAGNPPNDLFHLPSRRHPEFDFRFFGPRNNSILHIARKTGTHIAMPLDMSAPSMMMWGAPDKIFLARQDLHALLEQVQQDIDQGLRRVGGWRKIKAAPSDKKQEEIERLVFEAKIRQTYRHPPPVGYRFPCVGIFVWPIKDLNPQNSLGMALEYLDDIRFDQRVFILFSRKQGIIRVLGEDQVNVNNAIDRISTVVCEIATGNRRTTKILVHPPSAKLPATKVIIKDNHGLINRQVTFKRMQENKGIQVLLGGVNPSVRFLDMWETKREIMKRANQNYIRKGLQQALRDVWYYRGHAKLRVYIGRIVLFEYKRTTEGAYDIQDFSEMVRSPQASGEVIRSVGSSRYGVTDKEVAQALIMYCNDHRDLYPWFDFNTLEPQITATFGLRLYDEKGRSQDIRLEIVFEKDGDEWRPVHRRWLNASSGGRNAPEVFGRRCGPLDIKVMNIENDLTYQIEIATWPLYKDSPDFPVFSDFVRKLRVEKIPDEFDTAGPPLPGQPDTRPHVHRICFVNLPGISVAAVVQKTKWRYWMSNSYFVFEITNYEHLPIHEVSTLYPDGVQVSYKGLNTPFDSRWGCAILNSEWDDKLSQQSTLEVGSRVKWDPEIEKFMPGKGGFNGDGFEQFIGRIKEAMDLVTMAQRTVVKNKQADVGLDE